MDPLLKLIPLGGSRISGLVSGRNNRAKNKKPKRKRPPRIEWVGGLVESPFTVAGDEGPAYSPVAVLWLQRPPGIVVTIELCAPDATAGVLAASLTQALARRPARPTSLRVASQALAAEVRARVDPGIPIIVGPTPELVAALDELGGALANGPPTALDSSLDLPPELLDAFFASATALRISAPWEYAADTQLIRVDVPELKLAGACLSILGAGGQEYGIALFESPAHFDAFYAAATNPLRRQPIDLGGEQLLLSFDDERDVPKAILRRAKGRGWSGGGKRSFPTLLRVLRDGSLGTATADQIALMTALATAVGVFTLNHRALFEQGYGSGAVQTFADRSPQLTLTAPYQAAAGDPHADASTRGRS